MKKFNSLQLVAFSRAGIPVDPYKYIYPFLFIRGEQRIVAYYRSPQSLLPLNIKNYFASKLGRYVTVSFLYGHNKERRILKAKFIDRFIGSQLYLELESDQPLDKFNMHGLSNFGSLVRIK